MTESRAAHGGPLVVVVGSANIDVVIELESPPHPGETVLGAGVSEHPGGKGANQAIAAAQLASTAFVGAVGDDTTGAAILHELADKGVSVDFVRRVPEPSGRAFIMLTPDGENRIVVIPGANRELTSMHVLDALSAADPAVVIAQQEIAADAVATAAHWAVATGRRFMLNASPLGPIAPRVLAAADPLVVNADEARQLMNATGELDGEQLAARLLTLSKSVIVTAGARGAFIASEAGVDHVPAESVAVVDTTGAGDCFAGTVAGALANGSALRDAAVRGVRAAARLVALKREDR